MLLQDRVLVQHATISQELAALANLKQHEVYVGEIAACEELLADWLLEVLDDSGDCLDQVVTNLFFGLIAEVTRHGGLFVQFGKHSC